MEVCLPAQERDVDADGRRCTWMYETRNETALGATLSVIRPAGAARGGAEAVR
jgi:hypothetical protein